MIIKNLKNINNNWKLLVTDDERSTVIQHL